MTYSDDLSQALKSTVDQFVAAQIAPVQAQADAIQAELNTTNDQVTSLQSANAQLNDDISGKSAQIASLTYTVQVLQDEINRLDNLLDEVYDVRPGGSIQAVLDAKPSDATIKIAPGEYRLTAPLVVKSGQEIVGAGSDKTILKGSVQLNVWNKGSDGIWVATGVLPATYTDTGQCDINSGTEANPCQKREDLFLDGKRLDRVMQLTSLKAGTYFADYAENKLYLFDIPNNVELCKTWYAIYATTNGGRLSALTVKHFATPSQAGAVTLQGTGWEVDNCLFTDNHASGLHLSQSHNTQVHHNEFVANGQAGMTHYKSNATSVTYNLFKGNNTAGYYKRDWESAGFKATYSAQTMFAYNTVVQNEGVGVWFDIDNTDYVISDNIIDANFSCGIRVEISFSGEIARNTVTRNGIGHAGPGRGSDFSGFATAGIHINSAGGMGAGELRIHDNLIGVALVNGVYVAKGYGNQNALHIEQRDRGNSGTYPTLTRTARNVKVTNNKVNVTKMAGVDGTGVVGLGVIGTTGSQIYLPATGNTFESNEYFNTSLTDVQFHCMDGTATNRYRTFARWQQLGYDKLGKLTLYSAA